ncbi:lysosome-associated membrane glycoprotein 1a [Latimeria chalumnae]|uniref:Lysosome-associated membrane glycoprotein 1 n=1 Tax=Latimeria chalumnae TaxID=7897 RepID=H3AAT9_LATCH|nr:PREDICTED: lysosome-associated membrane glycoprotein 1 [Latimeria chalumnae]|eukprot:XP_014345182.1 PREDICTED: lysosome-associated membrane glycoprotein 1 [Latimeria chalumnae]
MAQLRRKQTLLTDGSAVVVVLLFLSLAGFLQKAHGVSFEVKDGTNETCLIAEISANFSVTYVATSQEGVTHFVLPDKAIVDKSSTCGNDTTSPLLAISFETNNTLRMNFSRNSTNYHADKLTFTYSLTDSTLFPNATLSGPVTVSTAATDIDANVNTTYRCLSVQRFLMPNVTIDFSSVRIEAYAKGNFSKDESVCSRDTASTTVPTPKSTTPAPTKTPDPGNPETFDYNVTGSDGICLLAKMGLQLNITYKTNETSTVFNIKPNFTTTGICGNNSAVLIVTDKDTVLSFFFALSAGKFYLGGVHMDEKQANFSVHNDSLGYMRASLGKSYMCNSEQKIQVAMNFSINAFNVRIQAFKIDGDKFGIAEECQQDEDNMLIPIIVGAALAGLVLIVLIAYLIGRKRSHAGYQTI